MLGNEVTKYDVPLNHLESEYIKNCNDGKELEKILKILRSREEGFYPHLEKEAEDRLSALKPTSRLLRKDQVISSLAHLSKEEQERIRKEFEKLTVQDDEEFPAESNNHTDDPPVRGSAQAIHVTKEQAQKAQKRVKPRDYQEWDKINIDEELAKVDDNSVKKVEVIKPAPLPPKVLAHTEKEKKDRAELEKKKGNEAYRSGDLEEAVLYYSRSLSLVHQTGALNNRAQSYIRMKRWPEAITDCTAVLKEEPNNIKALLRRGTAYHGRNELKKAAADMEKVLEMETHNTKAQDLMKDIKKGLEEQKVKGRRMVIDEVDEVQPEVNTKDVVVLEESTNEKIVENGTGGGVAIEGEQHKQANKEKRKNKADITTKKETETLYVQKNGIATDNWAKGEPCEMKTQNEKMYHQPPKIKTTESNEMKIQKENMQEQVRKVKTKCGNRKPKKDGVKIEEKSKANKGTTEVGSQSSRIQSTGEGKDGMNAEREIKENLNGPNESKVASTVPLAEEEHIPLPLDVQDLKEEASKLYRQGDYSGALKAYSSAISSLRAQRHSPSMMSLQLSNRAACKMKVGDCSGCVDDCNEALTLDPLAGKARLRRAVALEALERYRQAYCDYRAVLNASSSTELAKQGLSRVQAVLTDQDGPNWRQFLPLIPPTPKPANSSSHTASATPVLTPPAPTRELLEKQFEEIKEKGNQLVAKGQFAQALDCYAKCMQLYPDNVAPYTNRAHCYLKLNQATEALADCNLALKLQSDNIKAMFRRALAYKMLGQYEECLADLNEILLGNSKNASALKEKAEVQALYEAKFSRNVPIEIVDEDDAELNKFLESFPEFQAPAAEPAVASQTKTNGPGPESVNPGPRKVEVPVLGMPIHTSTFMKAWRSLRSAEPSTYLQLLQQVAPSQLVRVFGCHLEGDMLIVLVRCCTLLLQRGQCTLATEYLRATTQLERFKVNAMFMSAAEKKEVEDLIRQLNCRDLQPLFL